MRLNIVPPDSVYVRKDGQNIVIGWYPPRAEIGSVAGSRHWSNWLGPDPNISQVEISGSYNGTIDRSLKVGRIVLTTVTVDTVGVEPSIRMYAELRDRFDTYYKEFNLGASYYTIPPGDTVGPPIPLNLIGLAMGDTIRLGIALAFGAGIIDSTFTGGPASFEVDLQTNEGFHIWRWEPQTPDKPTHLSVISEFSIEDAYIGIFKDDVRNYSIRTDAYGRLYWEFVDTNAFAGFTYYYIVTCFDRGYFRGLTQFNKRDNFICYETWSNPDQPNPVPCEGVGKIITMTVGAGTDIRQVFAVPNPYRTGTSAETRPFYHNYPDGCIKFFNVPREADIKIYTVSGDLVWEAHHSSPTGEDGIISWNVKNQQGQDVGSGVYIFRCKNSADGSDAYGKLVVIR